MKITLEVTGLETNGEQLTVRAQGTTDGAAEWRNYDAWKFEVPEHIGRKYRVGQKLRIDVRPL